MVVLGLRLHVFDIDDGSLGIHEGDRQRQQRIAHPHAVGVLVVEDEEHAMLLRHGLAVHQAKLAVLVVGGHLRLDAVEAGTQFEHRHDALRLGAAAQGQGGERGNRAFLHAIFPCKSR